ncbi:SpoIIE family protein phosphatase [Dactylosporangium vinaceum]|nr:SpoIIE family protein phosphatase [Dactylosporangium vinaceum]
MNGMRPGRRLLLTAGLLLLLLGSACSVLIYRQHERAREAALADAAGRARLAAIEVFGYRLGIVRSLQTLATDPALRGAAPAAVQARLANAGVSFEGLTGGLAWADAGGVVRASTGAAAGAPTEAEWSPQALGDSAWIVTPALHSASFTGEVLIFAVPTRDDTGRITGVLAGGWGLDFVRAVTDERNATLGDELYGSNAELFVVDRDGRLIAGPGIGRTQPMPPAVGAVLEANRQRFAYGARPMPTGLDGRPDQVVAFARFEPFGESVVVQRPAAATFASADGAMRREATELGAVLLAIGAGGIWLARRVDRLDAPRRSHIGAANALAWRVQRSLLPQTVPADVLVRYQPASRPIAVGGDWYDVLPLGPSGTMLIIGDVAGHDIDAALVMGQLRTAAAVLAEQADGPADMLHRLAQHVDRERQPTLTTMFCAMIDETTGDIRYASAGHPPALLRRPDGTVQRLDGAPGPALGIGLDSFHETSIHAAGATLLLYTDGLIERPGEDLYSGMDRLATAFGRHNPLDSGGVDDILADVLRGAEPTDDIAILVFPVPTVT